MTALTGTSYRGSPPIEDYDTSLDVAWAVKTSCSPVFRSSIDRDEIKADPSEADKVFDKLEIQTIVTEALKARGKSASRTEDSANKHVRRISKKFRASWRLLIARVEHDELHPERRDVLDKITKIGRTLKELGVDVDLKSIRPVRRRGR